MSCYQQLSCCPSTNWDAFVIGPPIHHNEGMVGVVAQFICSILGSPVVHLQATNLNPTRASTVMALVIIVMTIGLVGARPCLECRTKS